jgi:hypothetical protein
VRVFQCGAGDETLCHQGAAVVKAALGNVHLGTSGLGLLARLIQSGLRFLRVDAGQHLTGS